MAGAPALLEPGTHHVVGEQVGQSTANLPVQRMALGNIVPLIAIPALVQILNMEKIAVVRPKVLYTHKIMNCQYNILATKLHLHGG